MAQADLRMRPGCIADIASYGRGWKLFWDPRGRSSRTELAMLCIVPVVLMWVFAGAVFLSGISADFPDWLALATMLAFLMPIPAAIIRRLHDSGKTGWLALPIFILIGLAIYDGWLDAIETYPENDLWYNRGGLELIYAACWLAAIVLLIWPVRDENNRYGPNPRPAEKVI